MKKKIESNQKKKKVERFAMRIKDGKQEDVIKKNHDISMDLRRKGL
jgi:hypothetical protein